MEHIAKILEFVANYAWAILAVCLFLVFVPSDAASQLGLLDLRESNKGLLWLLILFTGALTVRALLRYMDQRVLGDWLAERRKQKAWERERAERLEVISNRLGMLNKRERAWIQYCLFHNVQTVSAQRADPTAQSLLNKRILSEGSGSLLDLPYHIPDDVWSLLQERRAEFLSEEDKADKEFERFLEQFRRTLWPEHWR